MINRIVKKNKIWRRISTLEKEFEFQNPSFWRRIDETKSPILSVALKSNCEKFTSAKTRLNALLLGKPCKEEVNNRCNKHALLERRALVPLVSTAVDISQPGIKIHGGVFRFRENFSTSPLYLERGTSSLRRRRRVVVVVAASSSRCSFGRSSPTLLLCIRERPCPPTYAMKNT